MATAKPTENRDIRPLAVHGSNSTWPSETKNHDQKTTTGPHSDNDIVITLFDLFLTRSRPSCSFCGGSSCMCYKPPFSFQWLAWNWLAMTSIGFLWLSHPNGAIVRPRRWSESCTTIQSDLRAVAFDLALCGLMLAKETRSQASAKRITLGHVNCAPGCSHKLPISSSPIIPRNHLQYSPDFTPYASCPPCWRQETPHACTSSYLITTSTKTNLINSETKWNCPVWNSLVYFQQQSIRFDFHAGHSEIKWLYDSNRNKIVKCQQTMWWRSDLEFVCCENNLYSKINNMLNIWKSNIARHYMTI